MLNVGKDLICCKCLVTPSGIKFIIENRGMAGTEFIATTLFEFN